MRHEFDKYQGDAGESLGIKINVREMIYAAIRKFSLMRIKIDAESSYAGQRSLPAIAITGDPSPKLDAAAWATFSRKMPMRASSTTGAESQCPNVMATVWSPR